MDDEKMLGRPALLLKYRFRRSGGGGETGPSLHTLRTGQPHTQNKQLVLATPPVALNLIFQFSNFQLLHTLQSPRYTMSFEHQAKLGAVPHASTSVDKRKRVDVCTSLLNRHRTLV